MYTNTLEINGNKYTAEFKYNLCNLRYQNDEILDTKYTQGKLFYHIF